MVEPSKMHLDDRLPLDRNEPPVSSLKTWTHIKSLMASKTATTEKKWQQRLAEIILLNEVRQESFQQNWNCNGESRNAKQIGRPNGSEKSLVGSMLYLNMENSLL